MRKQSRPGSRNLPIVPIAASAMSTLNHTDAVCIHTKEKMETGIADAWLRFDKDGTRCSAKRFRNQHPSGRRARLWAMPRYPTTVTECHVCMSHVTRPLAQCRVRTLSERR